MKDTLKTFLIYFLSIFFVITIFNKGIILPTNIVYVIATFLILVLSISLVSPILKFLTIKSNFLTFFLMSTIFTGVMLYLLQLFMVGFEIQEYQFEGFLLGTVQVNAFIVTPIMIMIGSAVLTSLISAIYRALDEK